MARKKTTIMPFKRGDDFKVDFTLTNTNHITALSLKATLEAEKLILEGLEAADPLDTVAIATQAAAVQVADDAYEDSILMDISGWVISAQLRRFTNLVSDFTINMDYANIGRFTLTCPASETQMWKPVTHQCDIQFERGVGKVSSETFLVEVEKDVTYA